MKLPVMQECVHWHGAHHETCAAGVQPKSLVDTEPGWIRKIPCVSTPNFPRIHGGRECPHHVWATDEQRAAKFADVLAVDAAISELPYHEQRRLAMDNAAFEVFVKKVLDARK